MNRKQVCAALAALILVAAGSAAEVITSEVVYRSGETTMKGTLAVDEAAAEGRRPVVLVVHEWWGLNDYARERAKMLAQLGYLAMAVDMYGEGKTAEHPRTAGEFAKAVLGNPAEARARFDAALETARKHPLAHSSKVAAIGYCFGGATVLNMARMNADLLGVVSFHGSLASSTKPSDPIKPKILVCHGGEDQFVTAPEVAAFKLEMDAAHADLEFVVYPEAKHSFTFWGADAVAKQYELAVGYNPAADKASWADMKKFLEEIFR